MDIYIYIFLISVIFVYLSQINNMLYFFVIFFVNIWKYIQTYMKKYLIKVKNC